MIYKTVHWKLNIETQTPLKPWESYDALEGYTVPCFISGTRHVILVQNPMVSHEYAQQRAACLARPLGDSAFFEWHQIYICCINTPDLFLVARMTWPCKLQYIRLEIFTDIMRRHNLACHQWHAITQRYHWLSLYRSKNINTTSFCDNPKIITDTILF